MAVVIGTVINQTSLNTGDIIFLISHQVVLEPSITAGGINQTGLIVPWPKTPGENIASASISIVNSMTGQIVTPGSLLSTIGAGGLPLSSGGVLLTSSATIVDADLFS